MAKNCNACSELQEKAAEFVVNGVTDDVCTSLKNDTGFNPSSGNDDCTDLNNANDCLVGNMEDEIDAYEVCDWKEYMKKFVHNLWTVLKAMICAICGIWGKLNRHDCEINAIVSNATIQVTEARYASGVSPNSESTVAPRIGGNMYCGYMTGSLSFTENWANAHPKGTQGARGTLVYEYRIKKDAIGDGLYLKKLWSTNLTEGSHGIGFVAHIWTFTEGEQPFGTDSDDPLMSAVPAGYIYLQVRIVTRGDFTYKNSDNKWQLSLYGVIPWLITAENKCD